MLLFSLFVSPSFLRRKETNFFVPVPDGVRYHAVQLLAVTSFIRKGSRARALMKRRHVFSFPFFFFATFWIARDNVRNNAIGSISAHSRALEIFEGWRKDEGVERVREWRLHTMRPRRRSNPSTCHLRPVCSGRSLAFSLSPPCSPPSLTSLQPQLLRQPFHSYGRRRLFSSGRGISVEKLVDVGVDGGDKK